MQKLTITIETDAAIDKKELTAFGASAADYIIAALKPFWKGATVQSSKVKVTDVEQSYQDSPSIKENIMTRA